MADKLPFGWKKMTPNRKAYLKEYDRIVDIERTLGKEVNIKVPKDIRKRDVERLKNIKRSTINKQGRPMAREEELVLDNVQDMIESFNIERMEESLTATEGFLKDFKPTDKTSKEMHRLQTERYNILQEILKREIDDTSRETVARRLNDRSAKRLVELIQNAIYPSDEALAVASIIEFANLIKGSPMSRAEAEELEQSYQEAYEFSNEDEEI